LRNVPRSAFAGGEPIAVFDGLCRKTLATQGREVLASGDPLEAEMWVSCLLAMWSELPMIDEPDPATAIGCRLVSVAQKRPTPEAQMSLRALAAVAGGDLGRRAEEAKAGLGTVSDQVPSWTRMIGTAEPTTAWRASDVWGDQDAILVGFRYPDGAEHCVMVLVDHLLGGIAKDATVLWASLDAALSGWDREYDLAEEGIGQAANRIMDAAEVTERIGGESITGDYTDTAALLAARFGPLAAGASVPDLMPAAERDDLARRFLAARRGRLFARDADARFLLNVLIEWRCDAGADPLRWSDSAVTLFLLDFLPRCLIVPGVQLQRAPDVLRAWIPWAAARAGLPTFLAEEALAIIEGLRDEALEAVSDESRWHPAKRVAMRMLAEGVDLSDAHAVDEWLLSGVQ
jgi:hypothetical protein